MYLKSNHPGNFKHDKEDARIVGIVLLESGFNNKRMCFDVVYDSDNKKDLILCSVVFAGNYEIYYK